jgi:multiple sugar transport system permease protein
MSTNTRRRGGLAYTAIGIGILAVFLFPVYWMINVSLQPSGSAVGTPWIPTDISLDGYAKALRDQGRHVATSLLIASGSVGFSLLLAAPAAYALARFRIRWAGVVLAGVLVTQMIPGIVVANALYSAYSQLGLLNTVWGLILADSTAGVPFAMLILRAFMTRLPASVIEAAAVDGAGPIRTFLLIVLPMSRNALITAALFTFLFAWGDFLFALTLTTTPDARPVTLGLYTYIGTHVTDWSSVMATAVLASLPAVVLLVAAQRFLAAGTTTGAVK